MGSPDFSLPAFQAVCNHKDFEVVGLYCQPDKKKGRGQKLAAPPCKIIAEERNIPVFQPGSLKRNDEEFEKFKNLKPDLVLVVAYGKILPTRFINLPKFGTINIHSSLLPRLRGAAPINWAIVRGDTKTGITVMNVIPKLDSGDILHQVETPISPTENASELHDRLAQMSADIIVETLERYFRGEITPIPQNDAESTYAPIIKKEDGRIDFRKSGKEIINLIRGFSPWPGSFAELNGKLFKIIDAELQSAKSDLSQHEVGELFDTTNGLVKIKDSVLKLKTVQLAGKRQMDFKTFILGFRKTDKIILK
jgi:methionyl-tRNA formyltransferase